MIQPIMLFLAFLATADGSETKKFSDIEIEKPFDTYLLANPLLMEVTGAKLIQLPNGNQVVIAVASTVRRQLELLFALTHGFCYREGVVASR